jgi:hypothetical protein
MGSNSITLRHLHALVRDLRGGRGDGADQDQVNVS